MLAFRKEVIEAAGDEFQNLGEEELEQVSGGAVALVIAVGLAAGAGGW